MRRKVLVTLLLLHACIGRAPRGAGAGAVGVTHELSLPNATLSGWIAPSLLPWLERAAGICRRPHVPADWKARCEIVGRM